MSEEKTPKKESKKVKKAEKKEATASSEASDKTVDEASPKSTDASAEKSSDASSDKSAAPDKSASQTSISHFSSVTTKEYRSGWETIFGSNKPPKKIGPKGASNVSLPAHIEIQDQDIKDDLRILLYKAFQRQARREGISLAKYKKLGVISFHLKCDIIDK